MQSYFKFCIILLLLVKETPGVEYNHEEYIAEFQVELYSKSVLGFVKLYKLEQKFLEHLSKFTEHLQQKVNMIQVYLKNMKRPTCLDQNECEKYVSNPLNTFGIIRRLHEDWPKWLEFINLKTDNNSITNIEEEIVSRLPGSHDMGEMLKNLHRIETTYEIEPNDLANGILPKTELNWTLTVRDCVTLGNYKSKIGDYERARKWYRYALKHQPERNAEFDKQMLGDPLNGVHLKYIQAMLSLGTQREDPTLSIQEIHDEVLNVLEGLDANLITDLVKNQPKLKRSQNTTDNNDYHLAHESGCRGLYPLPTNLVCRYNFTTTPFLRLAPLKLEEISIDPYIVQYHDVLSDNEIEEMKRQAIAANMTNGWTSLKSDNETENEGREIVARLAWIYDSSEVLDRINRRIVDMTGLDIKNSIGLQIATYSIGGSFMPHYDYFKDRSIDTEIIKQLGDRLATIIFYAGDVFEGGQTIFPRTKLMVTPKKGSSLFWFNKFDDGKPDPRSLHSVCPVIVGSRWTITKWFHHDLQMFAQPCSLEPSSSVNI